MQTTSTARPGTGGGDSAIFTKLYNMTREFNLQMPTFQRNYFLSSCFFPFYFYQFRYMWHFFSLIQELQILPCSLILHCICKRKRQLLKIYLFSRCSEDISKNTGVLIPHLIDPPSCPPHFPRSLAQDWNKEVMKRRGRRGYLAALQSMVEKITEK